MDYIRSFNISKNSIIYKIFICLFLDLGFRVFEVLNIRIFDIDFKNNIIFIYFIKIRKFRYVLFSEFSN